MQTLSVTKYDQLSEREWARVADTARLHVLEITGKDCDIGIGRKFRGGKPYGWQISLRVYLPRKRKRVAKSKQIPARFQIRLKRGKRFVLVEIRSDVDSRSDFVPTGATVKLGSRIFSTGGLLRWREDGQTQWGFLTVAHEFDASSRRRTRVRVSETEVFDCELLFTASSNRNLDSAVMKILGDAPQIVEDLIDAGLIEHADPLPVSLLRTGEVKRAAIERKRGRTYPPGGSHPFIGEDVFPNGFLLGQRRLDDCIRVGQQDRNVFAPGTSGALWRFGRRAACMQAGGRAPDFEDGIGQPYAAMMTWVRGKLGRSVELVAGF